MKLIQIDAKSRHHDAQLHGSIFSILSKHNIILYKI
jgi:hypothetical protein